MLSLKYLGSEIPHKEGVYIFHGNAYKDTKSNFINLDCPKSYEKFEVAKGNSDIFYFFGGVIHTLKSIDKELGEMRNFYKIIENEEE